MNILEKEVEARLVKMVQGHGGLCLKWVCLGWAGVPDRLILMPGGWALFAETKRPRGGALARRQVWWQQKLCRLGFECRVIHNDEDIRELDIFIAQRLTEAAAP